MNDSQKRAMLHDGGPILVLAGAGSGKTRVLTHRISRLVKEKRCKPSEILAVTFTNKAAREMRERVAALTSSKAAEAMTISTFHSLGVRILREDGGVVGIGRSFTILDDHERTATLRGVMRTSGIRGIKDEECGKLAVKISLAKNGALEPDAYKRCNPDERKAFRVYKAYHQVLTHRQAVDFDDLLLLPLLIFRKDLLVLEKYRKRYAYLSIDEFQDTNATQLELITMLASPRNNLFAVGDDDQGIYSWRGAEINNLLGFRDRFDNCESVVLGTNYRSTENILGGAMAVIGHNRRRTQKAISAAGGRGEPIRHFVGDDEEEEAAWVAESIRDNRDQDGFAYADQAILLRTNALTRRYEVALRELNIPYRISGGMSFFERREIKDIIAYLRFFANPADEMSLLRVLKVPSKGITPGMLEDLDELAAGRRVSLFEAIQSHAALKGQSAAQAGRLAAFVGFYEKYLALLLPGKLAEAFRVMLEEVGYMGAMKRAARDDGEYADRLANVEELLHGLKTYERKRRGKAALDGFLQELALTSNDDKEEKDEKSRGVTIMTLHKSKGLEFPVVFLCALDRDIIPSPRSVEEGGIEEERRLFYVGMTRAKERLFLTFPATKVTYGKQRQVIPCQFVHEIPQEFLDGPIGQQHQEDKAAYVQDFFADMQRRLAAG